MQKFFQVHPDDARWLRRWLRNNLFCVMAIVCFVLVIRLTPSASLESANPARADRALPTMAAQSVTARSATPQLPPETELVLLQSRHPNPIAPQGWRRTSQGWEHASNWAPVPRPLAEIIQTQLEREPAWMQLTLAKLRRVPPLLFALLQITAIAVIVNVSRNGREIRQG